MRSETRRLLTALSFCLAAACLFLFAARSVAAVLQNRREARYLDDAMTYAEEFSLSPALVLAVISVESDFKPDAVSPAGAVGLMQLMPETYRYVMTEKLKETPTDSGIFDPAVNIRCGCCYLAYLSEKFDDIRMVLAAYNAGEGRVQEWLCDPEISPKGTLGEVPFPETRNYIEKVLAANERYLTKYPSLSGEVPK